MKNNGIVLSAFLFICMGSLASASQVVPQISSSALNQILENDSKLNDSEKKSLKNFYDVDDKPIENKNFKVNIRKIQQIRDSSYKGSFEAEKSSFTLKNLLSDLEEVQQERDSKLNIASASSYIAKDGNMKLRLSIDEYNQVIKAYSIDIALDLINKFTGLNLSYKLNTLANNAKVLNIGVWTEYDIYNYVKYVTLEPKEQTSYLYGSSDINRAFFYFKTFDVQFNKDVHFNLNIDDTLELYKRLVLWRIDKDFYNEALAFNLTNITSEYQNFNSKKMFKDLLENPTVNKLNEVKSNYDYMKSNNSSKMNLSIEEGESLESIILSLNRYNEMNYLNTDNIELKNLKIQLPKKSMIYSFSDLEKYSFIDKETYRTYKIKAINNNYLKNSSKDFVVYSKKGDSKQEALRYLNKALEESKTIKSEHFTYDLFKDDIESIKKGLL